MPVYDTSSSRSSESASRASRVPAPMQLPRREMTRPRAAPARAQAELEQAFGADVFERRTAPITTQPRARKVDVFASEVLAREPAEDPAHLVEAGEALADARGDSARTAAPPKFVWKNHPANRLLSERVDMMEDRYPELELGWLLDWTRQFIEQVVAKGDAAPEERGAFDRCQERMARELARRIAATNPESRAGDELPQRGLSGGTGTHLWTGGISYKAAQAAARRAAETERQAGNSDAASVEMTIAGELLDSLVFSGDGVTYANDADKLWNELSRSFAGNARGTVHVHTLYGVRYPSIFQAVEAPALLHVLMAQEAREEEGRKQDGPVVDAIVMEIYYRMGEFNPETEQLEIPADEDGVRREELVKQREIRVTTSYQLEKAQSDWWPKEYAFDPTFAVTGSVRHRAARFGRE